MTHYTNLSEAAQQSYFRVVKMRDAKIAEQIHESVNQILKLKHRSTENSAQRSTQHS
ncbi:MAG: hypothetical protein QW158_02925 [Nitrososphaerales archaeon]